MRQRVQMPRRLCVRLSWLAAAGCPSQAGRKSRSTWWATPATSCARARAHASLHLRHHDPPPLPSNAEYYYQNDPVWMEKILLDPIWYDYLTRTLPAFIPGNWLRGLIHHDEAFKRQSEFIDGAFIKTFGLGLGVGLLRVFHALPCRRRLLGAGFWLGGQVGGPCGSTCAATWGGLHSCCQGAAGRRPAQRSRPPSAGRSWPLPLPLWLSRLH